LRFTFWQSLAAQECGSTSHIITSLSLALANNVGQVFICPPSLETENGGPR